MIFSRWLFQEAVLCHLWPPEIDTSLGLRLLWNMYDFRTSQASSSISHNAGIAQELLRDLKFIYTVRLHSSKHPGRILTSSHQ